MSFGLQISMRWLPAFLLVGAQIIFLPIASYIFGDAQTASISVLIAVFAALALGETGLFSRSLATRSGVVLGAGLILFGVTFRWTLQTVWATDGLSWLLLLALLLSMVQVGKNLADGVYFTENKDAQSTGSIKSTQSNQSSRVTAHDFSDNYRLINLFAAVSVVAWLLIQKTLGLHIGLIALGFHLLLSSMLLRGKATNPLPELSLDRESSYSVAIGVLSSGFVSILFSVMDLVITPSGYEFPLYLVSVFWMLAIATRLAEFFVRWAGEWTSVGLVVCGCAGSAALLAVLFGGPDATSFYIDPLTDLVAVDWLFGIGHAYWHFVVFMMGLLILPYFFYAGLVPARSFESPKHNHLFFISVGNTLGMVAFGVIGRNADLGLRLDWLIVATALVAGIRLWPLRRGRVATLAVMSSLFGMIAFLPRIDDARVGIQGQRLTQLSDWRVATRESMAERPRLVNLEDIVVLAHHDGGVAYYSDRGGLEQRISLGAYNAKLHLYHDLVKSVVLRDLISESTLRVLILGLGNHQNLRDAQARFEELAVRDYQIDVVDNFGPFAVPEFRDAIARANGFEWERDSRVKLHIADAMQFLTSQRRAPYDIIMWNLTRAFHSAARKLYTVEYADAISSSLAASGIFVMLRDMSTIDCTMSGAFSNGITVGTSRIYPTGVGLYSNQSLKHLQRSFDATSQASCIGVRRLTLSRPFFSAEHWGIAPQTWLGEVPLGRPIGFLGSENSPREPETFATETAKLSAAFNGRGRPIFLSLPLSGWDSERGREMKQTAEWFVGQVGANDGISVLIMDNSSQPTVALTQTMQMIEAKVGTIGLLSSVALRSGEMERLGAFAEQRGRPLDSLLSDHPVPQSVREALPIFEIAESIRGPVRQAISSLVPGRFRSAGMLVGDPSSRPAAIVDDFRRIAADLGLPVRVVGSSEVLSDETLLFEIGATVNRISSLRYGFRVLLIDDLEFLNGDVDAWPDLKRTLIIVPWLAALEYDSSPISCRFSVAYRSQFGRAPGFSTARLYSALELISSQSRQPLSLENSGQASVTGRTTVTGQVAWFDDGARSTDHLAMLYFDEKGVATLYVPNSVTGVCPSAQSWFSKLPVSIRKQPW